MKKTIIMVLSLMLMACGGGDWENEELNKGTNPVDCKAEPQQCI